MAAFFDEVTGIVSAFDDAKIDFAVCGGIAMAIHGFVRATLDIEILVSPDKLDAAAKIAVRLGYELDNRVPGKFDGELPSRRFRWIKGREDRPLNVVLIPRLSRFRQREPLALRIGHFQFVGREELLELKRLSGTLQDHADIERVLDNADMAIERIEGRLSLMDQLWEMSIKLMKAGRGVKRTLPLPERLEERSFAARPEWREDPQK